MNMVVIWGEGLLFGGYYEFAAEKGACERLRVKLTTKKLILKNKSNPFKGRLKQHTHL